MSKIISIDEYLKKKAKRSSTHDTSKHIMLKLSIQEIFNILHALTIFRKIAVANEYKSSIDDEINNIIEQLNLQNIEVLSNQIEGAITFGDKVEADNEIGYVLGSGSCPGWIKVVIGKLDEMPIQLLKIMPESDDDTPPEAA